MKKIFLFLTLITLSTTSCKDYLQPLLDDELTLEQVFQDEIESEKFLASVYSFIPDPFLYSLNGDTNPFVFMSDDGKIPFTTTPAPKVTLGNWSSSSDFVGEQWSKNYAGIRAASLFIERIGQNKSITPERAKVWLAEARTLRAMYYFHLIRQYGPVIILPSSLNTNASIEELQLPRSSFDECVKYINSELDLAMPDLPDAITDNLNVARMSKLTALAIKSYNLLYAASPLFNGNPDYANIKNSDGKPLFNATYSAQLWTDAATVTKQLLDLSAANGKRLYREYLPGNVYDPIGTCKNIHAVNWNSEILYARAPVSLARNEGYNAPRQVTGQATHCVTQSMVDAYRMNNGKEIDEAGSGYVATGFKAEATPTTLANVWNAYVGREPRFYANITFSGSQWTAFGATTPTRIEFFNKGLSGKFGGGTTVTGYLLRKGAGSPTDPPLAIGKSFRRSTSNYSPSRNPVIYRLAEFYLNYAEALNESDPANKEILFYLNEIRDRGGIPKLTGTFSQAKMRELIQKERRIELCFENAHRYFDVKRWKLAEKLFNGPFYGLDMEAGQTLTDASFYKQVVFETRVFEKKHYLYPIPNNEIYKDVKLVQNLGW